MKKLMDTMARYNSTAPSDRIEEIKKRNKWKKGLCDYCKGLDTFDVDNTDFLLSEVDRLTAELQEKDTTLQEVKRMWHLSLDEILDLKKKLEELRKDLEQESIDAEMLRREG